MFLSEGGNTDFAIELTATPGSGWMWAGESGGMGFCTNPGAGFAFTGTSASNAMGTNRDAAISGLAPVGFAPSMSVLCDGDYMQMMIDLPEPIGTVTYRLNRIRESALPPGVTALYDARMGR